MGKEEVNDSVRNSDLLQYRFFLIRIKGSFSVDWVLGDWEFDVVLRVFVVCFYW